MKTHNKSIIKFSIPFSIISFFLKGLGAISTFIIARILSPYFYGIWQWFSIFIEYGRYSHFGVLFAFSKEYPYRVGKREDALAEDIRNTAFKFNIYSSLIFSGILSIILFFSYKTHIFKISSLLLGVTILLQEAYIFYSLYLRAKKDFKKLIEITTYLASIKFVLVIGLAYFIGLYGVFLGYIIANLMVIGIYYLKSGALYYKAKINFKILRLLIKIGFPILLFGVAFSLFLSIDRIMIMKFLGPKQLGYYGLATGIALLLYSIRSVIGNVISPFFFENYGEFQDLEKIKNFIESPTRVMAYISPIAISFIYFLIPPLIHTFLPKYGNSIESIKIISIGTFFLIIEFVSQIIIALNKQLPLMKYFAVLFAVNILLNLLFIKLNYGIAGIAFATSISYFLYFNVLFFFSMREYKGLKDAFIFYTNLMLPFIFMCLLLIVISKIAIFRNLYALQWGVFILSYFPFLFYINKKENLIKLVYKSLLKK